MAYTDYMEPGDHYVSATFDGSGSASNSRARLMFWDWEFFSQSTGHSFGTARSAGSFSMQFFANDACWSQDFTARLTVTDANGNQAQGWCSVYYEGCAWRDPFQYPMCASYWCQ